MFLRKLYSEPEGLFQPIEFRDGFNLIVAHRPTANMGGSLNGVGKSTALDLIDFCLLGSYKKNTGNRLVAAKDLIEKYMIVLEFEVDGVDYIIKRSAEDQNIVYFSRIDAKLEEYTLKSLSPILSDLIFLPRDYKGRYLNTWYRNLMHFFVKIHKHKTNTFADPIEYMDKVALRQFVCYHLFFLGIDNELLYKNNVLVVDHKKALETRKSVQEVAIESYGIEDIAEKRSQLQQLRRDLRKLEQNIEDYKLSENYSDAEEEANKLTATVKELWLENISDRNRIKELRSSIADKTTFTTADARRTSLIYEELNKGFGLDVRATLQDAIEYRKKLIESRQNFIQSQVKDLENRIAERNVKLNKAEEERSNALSFLSARRAVADISEAYLAINRKRSELSELESIIATNDRVERQILEIETEESKLNLEIKDFVNGIQASDVEKITDTFLDIYSAIYKNEDRKPSFSIDDKMTTDSKVEIRVKVPSGLSKARNQGRILIYDLTVLLTMIKNKQRGPRFLIHDGVFDGMDPEHFNNLYIFLEEALHTGRFQYIATLNESESGGKGALSGPLADDARVSMKQLIDESVLDLTPNKKLFGEQFDD